LNAHPDAENTSTQVSPPILDHALERIILIFDSPELDLPELAEMLSPRAILVIENNSCGLLL
jgi:hypothetical protein